jgi:hypothetical protein
MRSTLILPLLVLLSLLSAGCAGPCPELKRLDANAEAPGLVQMVFSVRCEGDPVTEVTASDLTLTEGGEEVSRSEADWKIERFSAVLETYSLLLIDVSDSIVADGTLEVAQETARTFTETVVAEGQLVSVAIFDGASDVRTIIDFTADVALLQAAIDGINAEDQSDPASTNLNGAVLQGLEVLDDVVAADVEAELESVGSLVVFTDGVDTAARETDGKARNKVNASDHNVFVVGLVGEDAIDELSDIGKSGFFRASDSDALAETFGDLTDSLVAEVNKFYRLSYCSPLRSPRTTLKVEVSWDDKKSSLTFQYPTREFGQGCQLPAGI